MTDNARKYLGEEARKLRKKAKLTQTELVERLNKKFNFNLYQNDISAFENTGEKLGLDRVLCLFEELGYTLTPSEKKTSSIYV